MLRPCAALRQGAQIDSEAFPGVAVGLKLADPGLKPVASIQGLGGRAVMGAGQVTQGVIVPVNAHRVAIVGVVGFPVQAELVAGLHFIPELAPGVKLKAGQGQAIHQYAHLAGLACLAMARQEQQTQEASKAPRIHWMRASSRPSSSRASKRQGRLIWARPAPCSQHSAACRMRRCLLGVMLSAAPP